MDVAYSYGYTIYEATTAACMYFIQNLILLKKQYSFNVMFALR